MISFFRRFFRPAKVQPSHKTMDRPFLKIAFSYDGVGCTIRIRDCGEGRYSVGIHAEGEMSVAQRAGLKRYLEQEGFIDEVMGTLNRPDRQG